MVCGFEDSREAVPGATVDTKAVIGLSSGSTEGSPSHLFKNTKFSSARWFRMPIHRNAILTIYTNSIEIA